MKRIFSSLLTICAIVFLFTTISYALCIEYDAGEYETPPGLTTIYSHSLRLGLHHSLYYIIGLNDLGGNREIDVINIVFHNLYNETIEDNWLNVYIFNEPTVTGWKNMGLDYQDTNSPDWSIYNASHLGTWSYTGEAKDVVFTTTDPTLLSYLNDGNSFAIGIDPDCFFFGTTVTVETNAPVPEPATLLLLGSGLLGLAGLKSRKKS